MLRTSVEVAPLIGDNLQETFVSAGMPRHPLAQDLWKAWHRQPSGGFLTGRDLPGTDPASALSHVAIWQPVRGGADYLLQSCGPALKPRFAVLTPGETMSGMISPQLFAYLVHITQPLLDGSRTETLDISLSHSGFCCLHYEIVLFAARNPQGGFDLVSGAYYF